MKRITIILALLALCLSTAAISAEETTHVTGFLPGDDHIETDALTEIPNDTSTFAFPVSAVTAVRAENENTRQIAFRTGEGAELFRAYVIYDDTAQLRLEAAASDDPAAMVCFDCRQEAFSGLPELLDPERGVFVYRLPMPGAEADRHYACVCLLDREGTVLAYACLIAGDEYIDELADDMRARGYDASWEDAEPDPAGDAGPKGYILHIVDQDGAPVPGVMINFCTDVTCTMAISDDNGTVSFGGAPDVYHVQLLRTPKGYSFDPDFEMYTDRAYGEWVLRIRKD